MGSRCLAAAVTMDVVGQKLVMLFSAWVVLMFFSDMICVCITACLLAWVTSHICADTIHICFNFFLEIIHRDIVFCG